MKKTMFTVIYSFEIKSNQQDKFIETWKKLTLLIAEYEGGLGSRLHKKDALHYIGYAQWPDKKTFENEANKLPNVSEEIRKTMKQSCSKIEVLFELDVIEDLLKK